MAAVRHRRTGVDIVFQKPSGLISDGFFLAFSKLPLEIFSKSVMIVYDCL
jgi:hypothetical protein